VPNTSALLVAIPEDPEIAPEAHVTLTYFGEAATLEDYILSGIERECERACAMIAPFTASVAGTALLGPDKASVLLIESFELVRLRNELRDSPDVLRAEENAERKFPSWIPHLTMTYDGPVPEDHPEQIRFDSLGFWIAGEQKTYPLVGTETPVMASAVCIPEIMCLEDLSLGLRYASAHADARWYVMKRAAALGAPERIPPQWSRV
jgi:hypothetical protein